VGDILLTSFAERLTAALRIVDTLTRSGGTMSRFGSDEFVLLLDNIDELSGATLVAECIQNLLKDPFKIEGNEIYTTVSIGIAVSDGGGLTPEEFVRNADTAMCRAKAAGKARFELFDADMHSKAMARLELENEMRSTIAHNEYIPYSQPIVSLRTGKIEAFESLLRWENPEKGLLSPANFIPIAEETGISLPWAKASCEPRTGRHAHGR
jgi:predicted signal transduction protein with EAL and GGDEF domain